MFSVQYVEYEGVLCSVFNMWNMKVSYVQRAVKCYAQWKFNQDHKFFVQFSKVSALENVC